MKPRSVIPWALAAALILVIGYRSYVTYTSNRSYLPSINLTAPNPPSTTLTDPVEVFQKAFWKRPAPSDKILHAERREWSDANGIIQWQWFLKVQPSPELVKHLREDNAFGLVPGMATAALADDPPWFSPQVEDVDVLRSPSGSMRLLFSKTDGLLYATDTGGGFRPGTPERSDTAAATPATTGRLPGQPPPNPLKP